MVLPASSRLDSAEALSDMIEDSARKMKNRYGNIGLFMTSNNELVIFFFVLEGM